MVANASASGGTITVNADCSGVIQIPTPGGIFKFNILLNTAFDVAPPMVIVRGTAFPVVAVKGTLGVCRIENKLTNIFSA